MAKNRKYVKRAEALNIADVILSAYYVIADNEPTVVMALNIGDACDKLDKLGVHKYEFVSPTCITIVY